MVHNERIPKSEQETIKGALQGMLTIFKKDIVDAFSQTNCSIPDVCSYLNSRGYDLLGALTRSHMDLLTEELDFSEELNTVAENLGVTIFQDSAVAAAFILYDDNLPSSENLISHFKMKAAAKTIYFALFEKLYNIISQLNLRLEIAGTLNIQEELFKLFNSKGKGVENFAKTSFSIKAKRNCFYCESQIPVNEVES